MKDRGTYDHLFILESVTTLVEEGKQPHQCGIFRFV